MMVSRTQMVMAAVALVVAGSSGYMLQDGAPLVAPTRIVALSAALDSAAVPVDLAVPALPPLPDVAMRKADQPLPVLPESGAPQGCAPAMLTLSPLPGAMIGVAVEAPCREGERLEIFHAGLGFAVRLSDQASWQGAVPALTGEAAIALRFEAGDELLGRMRLADLPGLVRVGVEWRGTEPLELHAYENGAAFGAPGHVHAGAPEGRLMVLGDATMARPMQAQVYTAPAGGAVALEIATEIGPQSCGKPLEAKVFRAEAGAPAVLTAITLELPGCAQLGGYVVMPLPGLAARRLALAD
ncbi:hypothetical protein GCM10011341_22280 [Frigidibacter albus]|nr:hypothetical protein GCM10011341_22280 [Frigidibacter albus]